MRGRPGRTWRTSPKRSASQGEAFGAHDAVWDLVVEREPRSSCATIEADHPRCPHGDGICISCSRAPIFLREIFGLVMHMAGPGPPQAARAANHRQASSRPLLTRRARQCLAVVLQAFGQPGRRGRCRSNQGLEVVATCTKSTVAFLVAPSSQEDIGSVQHPGEHRKR